MKAFFLALVLITSSSAHKFHVSVMEIEYDPQNRKYEISQKIFLDDIELALKNFHRLEKLDVLNMSSSHLDSLLTPYLTKHISIVSNEKKLALELVGSEVEGAVIWCYVQSKKTRAPKRVTLTNTTLIQEYDDQNNIIHFTKGEYKKSFRLTPKENSRSLELK